MRISILVISFIAMLIGMDAALANVHMGCRRGVKYCVVRPFRSAAEFDYWCRHQVGKGVNEYRKRETAGCFNKNVRLRGA